MRENTLRNAPLDGLSITLTWSIPENPPSQGPEDFFSNYQLRFKDSQPDSSIICIVKNDGWSTGDYPYSYQLQNEREGISFDLDVDRFRIDMTKPDNYSNWDSFAPVIESGIDILLQALNKTVGATCFDSVSIRYDDWFPTEITGRDSSHFIRDVLGFSIALPDRIDEGFPSKGDESVQAYVNRHLAGCGPKFEPDEHIILKLTPCRREGNWYRWNQEIPLNSPPELVQVAAEFSKLKIGFRGDLPFRNAEAIDVAEFLHGSIVCRNVQTTSELWKRLSEKVEQNWQTYQRNLYDRSPGVLIGWI